ncbi:hypothetical protein [Kitasatospora indigofera]|uniref:hypothetical protein n=1 Tax=Kitasatospora indigofera TaxID=67307 RepID=UPI0033A3C5A0
MSTDLAPAGIGSTVDVVLDFDCRKSGTYVSAECQLDAHHGCPGGIRDEGRALILVCRCPTPECTCNKRRRPSDET